MKSDLKTLLRPTYRNLVRPILPKKVGKLNGVYIPDYKLGDGWLTERNLYSETYEDPLISLIKETVTEGDDVTLIGGGKGVSTVYASKKSKNGDVTVYEAVPRLAERIRKVVRYKQNEVPEIERIKVINAIVAEARATWGSVKEAKVLNPEEVSSCDVLVLDCEGAELEILESLNFEPDRIVVETHGCFDCPTEQVIDWIQSNGYDIKNSLWENKEKDVKVISASK